MRKPRTLGPNAYAGLACTVNRPNAGVKILVRTMRRIRQKESGAWGLVDGQLYVHEAMAICDRLCMELIGKLQA